MAGWRNLMIGMWVERGQALAPAAKGWHVCSDQPFVRLERLPQGTERAAVSARDVGNPEQQP